MIKQNKVPDLDDLLPGVPGEIASKWAKKVPLTAEENSLLEKYAKASFNASVPVLLGIEAIGNMLAQANIEEMEVIDIHNLGWLLAHLGKQAYLLKNLEDCAKSYMQPQTA